MKQTRFAIVIPCLFVALTVALVTPAVAEEIKIDRYETAEPSSPKEAKVLLRDFSIEHTDFGPMKKEKQKETVDLMKSTAPGAFREAFVQRLTEAGAFAGVEVIAEGAEVPAGALVLEGEFSEINPGSRAKRYMVGLGAGRSKICIKGHLVDGEGQELVKFEDCRSGTMGWFGGRSEGMMSQDVYLAARNLADFLSAWARNELPSPASKKLPA